jgi:hypothetical protein
MSLISLNSGFFKIFFVKFSFIVELFPSLNIQYLIVLNILIIFESFDSFDSKTVFTSDILSIISSASSAIFI